MAMEQSVKQTIYLSTKDNKLFRSQGAVGTVGTAARRASWDMGATLVVLWMAK